MYSTICPLPRVRILLLAALLACLAVTQTAQADRPEATRLLPGHTVGFVQVTDSNRLAERFMKTSFGRMSRDPQMQPVVERFYAELKTAMEPVEDRLGLSLGDLLAIPQGELTLAVVAPPDRGPAVVAILEVQEQIIAVEKLLEEADTALSDRGARRSKEKIGDTELTLYQLPGGPFQQLIYFERDGALVIGTDLAVLGRLLQAWDGKLSKAKEGEKEEPATLADNPHFTEIQKRCRGDVDDERPHITWFVDPVALFKAMTRDNSQAQFAAGFFGPLGLNGLRGVGGSMTFATEYYDTINRMHVLLDQPRVGVVDLIALGSGDTEPEKWVPVDANSYTTLHWDVEETYNRIKFLYDGFQGRGALSAAVQGVFGQADLDLENEILPLLEHRYTYVTWFEKPVTPFSQGTLIGIQLTDGEKFQPVLDKVVERLGDGVSEDAYLNVKFYKLEPRRGRLLRRPAREQADDEENPLRPPPREPCFMVLDNYLLITDRRPLMDAAIKAWRKPEHSLTESLEFKLIASKAMEQARGIQPAMLTFNRPEEGMKFLYDLATTDENRSRLEQAAENNRFFGGINRALKDQPLPPFDVLKKYLAPAGAVLIDEPSGIHYVSFALRRSIESKEDDETATKK